MEIEYYGEGRSQVCKPLIDISWPRWNIKSSNGELPWHKFGWFPCQSVHPSFSHTWHRMEQKKGLLSLSFVFEILIAKATCVF